MAWCRRKPAQAGLLAGLAVGVAGISWSWRDAVRQKQLLARRGASAKKARTQAAKAAAINRFLIDELLGQADPGNNLSANRVTLVETLDLAAAKVGSSFAGQPEIEAAIRVAIGHANHGLGEYAKSEVQFRVAWQILGGLPTGPGADGLEGARRTWS